MQLGARIVEGDLSKSSVLGLGTERHGEVEVGEEQGPMRLVRIEAFGRLEVRQVLMMVQTSTGCSARSNKCRHSSSASLMARSSQSPTL